MEFSASYAVLIGAGVVWIATFPLAWKMLARLVAQSASRPGITHSPSFWIDFILYRLVIFAPYGIILFFAGNLPDLVIKFVWGWVLLGLFLSFLRVVGSAKIVRILWLAYGLVYDGLNNFYPYRSLISNTAARLSVKDGMKVLDLGCGTGNLSRQLLTHRKIEIVGVDSSITMLSRARAKLRTHAGSSTLINADLLQYATSQRDGCFDRIAMVNVLYTVKNRERLWKESLRILSNDGIIAATTSDRTGSMVIIREHLNNDAWWKLLSPKLLAVAIIDYFISEFAKTKVFAFPSQETLIREVEQAGGVVGDVMRCYGGPTDGVNIMFTVRKRVADV